MPLYPNEAQARRYLVIWQIDTKQKRNAKRSTEKVAAYLPHLPPELAAYLPHLPPELAADLRAEFGFTMEPAS